MEFPPHVLPSAASPLPSPSGGLWAPLWAELENKGTVSEFSQEPSKPRVVRKFNESNSCVPFPVVGLSEENKSSTAHLWGLLCVNLCGGNTKMYLAARSLALKELTVWWEYLISAREKSAHNSGQPSERLYDT